MKIYLLSFLLVALLFSCNQKPTSENQKTEVIEEVQEKKKSVISEPLFNFDDYNDLQLDSIFRVSLDSMIAFLNVTEFEKDTVIKNEFTYALYAKAQDGFPDFVFIESMYPDLLDSLKTPTYLYTKVKDKFELKNQFEFIEMSWRNSELQRRDINFDGKIDVILQRGGFSSRMMADYLIIMDSDFKRITETSSTYDLLTDDKNKTVISFSDGGLFGTHVATISQWKGDNLVRIRQLEKTHNDQKEGFKMEEFVIRKGKKIKIKTQILSQDKAEEYFENYK